MVLVPAIADGCAGAEFTVTATDCGVLLPQPLLAVTIMVPLLVPAVVLMVLLVDVPLHPAGNAHV